MNVPRKKNLAILGSTGSIGRQALEVVRSLPDAFSIEVLTAQDNAGLLIDQAMEFVPNAVVIGNENLYPRVRDALKNHPIKVFAGKSAISEVLSFGPVDIVLTALVGIAGLEPTIHAITHGKTIALANKETLVAGGHLITRLVNEKRASIIPVDSEHSAIFQCLVGELFNPVEKIYLTASGGPFRGMDREQLATVTMEQALNHPNWDMGSKVTIDSATLMNKGLEVIEARWLFDLKPGQIEVVVHPQSIIHSVVQFEDGSMKAQMGLPDMKLPIQYALTYPVRHKSDMQRFSFLEYPQLGFEAPDHESFPCLKLAYNALEKGGNMPCVLNAANEVAVEAFLKGSIGFMQIPGVIARCLDDAPFISVPDIGMLLETDHQTRQMAWDIIGRIGKSGI
jgi:1-deoxy-D-xylulose-5-phosphate reductoisomerase